MLEPSKEEARTIIPAHRPFRRGYPAPITQFHWQGGLHVEDALPGRHDPRGLRSGGFHRTVGGIRTKTQGQSEQPAHKKPLVYPNIACWCFENPCHHPQLNGSVDVALLGDSAHPILGFAAHPARRQSAENSACDADPSDLPLRIKTTAVSRKHEGPNPLQPRGSCLSTSYDFRKVNDTNRDASRGFGPCIDNKGTRSGCRDIDLARITQRTDFQRKRIQNTTVRT